MKTLKRRLLLLIATMTVPLSLSAGTQRTVTLNVQNMTCAVCSITVKKALQNVPGVTSATVRFETKQAQVTFDDGLATVDKLREAATNAGYPATLASSAETSAQPPGDRVSLFQVGLECPAAPAIGCGSRAKPILRQLQTQSGIAEVWLKGDGTVLAVVGTDVDSDSRTKTVESVTEATGVHATVLTGENREVTLKSFYSRNDWYRGDDVDILSRHEATIIAARLVHRIQAKMTVAAENAKPLEIDLAHAIGERLVGDTESRAELQTELLGIARKYLGEQGVALFQEAFAKGYRPRDDDDEGVKNQQPACCSNQPS
jgi:mercuric transport protein